MGFWVPCRCPMGTNSNNMRGELLQDEIRLALAPSDCGCSRPIHYNIVAQIIFIRRVLRIDRVFLQHVSLPVVLPRERLCALPRIVAPRFGAVESAGFVMLVIDMSPQMCHCTKPPSAPWMLAWERPVVIPSVMIELMVRALHGAAHIADETARWPGRGATWRWHGRETRRWSWR
ncbi:hypothetical protein VTG60DRAFT_4352 [Thermothelomyces hinnuleus]